MVRWLRSIRALRVLWGLAALGMALGCIAPSAPASAAGENPKYVFLFIGDGMGMPQINAAEIYLKSHPGQAGSPTIQKLALSSLPVQGMCTTYSANSFITDSAPAATSLASGFKTDNGIIGMDPAKKKRFVPVSRMAKEKGRRVGVVSSVSIDHATPAAFYASVPSRKDYYDISRQLVDSGFDYFAGGGLLQPKGKKGDQPSSIDYAKEKGYRFVDSREEFLKLRPGVGKVLAFAPRRDEDQALPYALDGDGGDVSLAEFTAKGIELLDNPKGFFMMVEGGKIDWACHANDAAAAVRDTLAFDEAVRVARSFAARHPKETLIVVTGDHECGGMTIGFAGTQYETFFDKVRFQKGSYQAFDAKLAAYRKSHSPKDARLADLLPLIEADFGLTVLPPGRKAALEKMAKAGDRDAKGRLALALTPREQKLLEESFVASMNPESLKKGDETAYLVYGGYEPLSVTLTHLLNQKAGIGWTSYSHTGIPVPVFAEGAGQSLFQGYYDNTDIARRLMGLMGRSPVAVASR